jgi:hypothetical protein
MKTFLSVVIGLLLAGAAYAGTAATQTITFSVLAINELAVSGNPGALAVSGATAGSDPSTATDSSTTFAVTTNQSGQKITGAINTAMPSGTSLNLTLGAPSGATSAGAIALSTTTTNLVTGISTLAQASNAITYNFAATAAAGQVSSTSRTVTLTLTAGP